MIVSFSRRFLFVAIPKTATHSIRFALRPYLAKQDWEQCKLFEQHAFPIPALAKIGHGHLSCRQVRPYLFDNVWDGLCKFAAVRDPVERFLSEVWFNHGRRPSFRLDPRAYMHGLLDRIDELPRFRPQSDYLCDADGTLMVDRLIRVECLERDFQAVCAAIGLPEARLESRNVTRGTTGAPSRAVARDDQALMNRIRKAYAPDLALIANIGKG